MYCPGRGDSTRAAGERVKCQILKHKKDIPALLIALMKKHESRLMALHSTKIVGEAPAVYGARKETRLSTSD